MKIISTSESPARKSDEKQMSRQRTTRLLKLIVCSLIAVVSVGAANAQETDVLEQELTPEWAEQFELKLNSILKTRSDQEKVFVAQLVDNMEQGKVPIKLVSTSFSWVQKNRPLSNYPFIYFEKVLRLQAGKVGVADDIPPFDFETFRSSGQRGAGAQLDAGQQTQQQDRSLLDVARARLAKLFRTGGQTAAETSNP